MSGAAEDDSSKIDQAVLYLLKHWKHQKDYSDSRYSNIYHIVLIQISLSELWQKGGPEFKCHRELKQSIPNLFDSRPVNNNLDCTIV